MTMEEAEYSGNKLKKKTTVEYEEESWKRLKENSSGGSEIPFIYHIEINGICRQMWIMQVN